MPSGRCKKTLKKRQEWTPRSVPCFWHLWCAYTTMQQWRGDVQLNVCGSVSTPNVLMLQAQRVETVWQAACWRQTDSGSMLETDIAVLMLQARRVDRRYGRQHAGDRQTLLCWCCRHGEWTDGMAGSMLETDRHCCVDVAGTESGQTVWQAACWRQTDIAVLMLQAWRVDK